jgi:hypothetical protein
MHWSSVTVHLIRPDILHMSNINRWRELSTFQIQAAEKRPDTDLFLGALKAYIAAVFGGFVLYTFQLPTEVSKAGPTNTSFLLEPIFRYCSMS